MRTVNEVVKVGRIVPRFANGASGDIVGPPVPGGFRKGFPGRLGGVSFVLRAGIGRISVDAPPGEFAGALSGAPKTVPGGPNGHFRGGVERHCTASRLKISSRPAR